MTFPERASGLVLKLRSGIFGAFIGPRGGEFRNILESHAGEGQGELSAQELNRIGGGISMRLGDCLANGQKNTFDSGEWIIHLRQVV